MGFPADLEAALPDTARPMVRPYQAWIRGTMAAQEAFTGVVVAVAPLLLAPTVRPLSAVTVAPGWQAQFPVRRCTMRAVAVVLRTIPPWPLPAGSVVGVRAPGPAARPRPRSPIRVAGVGALFGVRHRVSKKVRGQSVDIEENQNPAGWLSAGFFISILLVPREGFEPTHPLR